MKNSEHHYLRAFTIFHIAVVSLLNVKDDRGFIALLLNSLGLFVLISFEVGLRFLANIFLMVDEM